MDAFDPDLLDRDARALWNTYAKPPADEIAATQMDLWGFAAICRLELGRIPDAINEALDPDLGPMLQYYLRRHRAARGLEPWPDDEHGT